MKVPEPRKLKSGTWFIQMRLSGESIPVSAPTRTECIKQAEKIKADYRNGQRLPCKSTQTLEQCAYYRHQQFGNTNQCPGTGLPHK